MKKTRSKKSRDTVPLRVLPLNLEYGCNEKPNTFILEESIRFYKPTPPPPTISKIYIIRYLNLYQDVGQPPRPTLIKHDVAQRPKTICTGLVGITALQHN
jgi:hypothetical protein